MGASNIPLIILLTLDIIAIIVESSDIFVSRYTPAPSVLNTSKNLTETHKVSRVLANEKNIKSEITNNLELMTTYEVTDSDKQSYLSTTLAKSKGYMGNEDSMKTTINYPDTRLPVMGITDPTVATSDTLRSLEALKEATQMNFKNVDNSFKLPDQNPSAADGNVFRATALFDAVADADTEITAAYETENSGLNPTVPGLVKQSSESAESSITSANERKRRAFPFFWRKTTTTTTTTTTLPPTTTEETMTTVGDICEYLALHCLRAYKTGNICGRTAFYLYASFQHYCMLDFINCKEGYDVWQIVHMGQCFDVELLNDYKHYPYENDYFLDKDYVIEN